MQDSRAEVIAHSLGDRVRGEMKQRGITQEKLAHCLGLSQPNISKRLSGQVEFTVSELAAVADYLGVELVDLLAAVAA